MTLTTKQLIRELKKYNQDLPVYISSKDGIYGLSLNLPVEKQDNRIDLNIDDNINKE